MSNFKTQDPEMVALALSMLDSGATERETETATGIERSTMRRAKKRMMAILDVPQNSREESLRLADAEALAQSFRLTAMTGGNLESQLEAGEITGKFAAIAYQSASRALSEQRGYRYRDSAEGEGAFFTQVLQKLHEMGQDGLEAEVTMKVKPAAGDGPEVIDVTPEPEQDRRG